MTLKKWGFPFFFFLFFLHEYDSLISKVAKMTDIRARCMDTKKKKKKIEDVFWLLGPLTRDYYIFYVKTIFVFCFCTSRSNILKKGNATFSLTLRPFEELKQRWLQQFKKDMLYVPSIHIFFFLRYAL